MIRGWGVKELSLSLTQQAEAGGLHGQGLLRLQRKWDTSSGNLPGPCLKTRSKQEVTTFERLSAKIRSSRPATGT